VVGDLCPAAVTFYGDNATKLWRLSWKETHKLLGQPLSY